MIPCLIPPTNLDTLLMGLEKASLIDIGHSLSVTMGCGRQTKYAQRWEWIIDYGDKDAPDHYSDLVTLDGFGRYEICRRSQWLPRTKWYQSTTNGRGRFEKFTKRTAEKVNDILTARVKGWHCCTINNTSCYKPTPWR